MSTVIADPHPPPIPPVPPARPPLPPILERASPVTSAIAIMGGLMFFACTAVLAKKFFHMRQQLVSGRQQTKRTLNMLANSPKEGPYIMQSQKRDVPASAN